MSEFTFSIMLVKLFAFRRVLFGLMNSSIFVDGLTSRSIITEIL